MISAPEKKPETETTSELDPFIGRQIGKYRILRLIGRGGMGQVYEGEDTVLRRRVAIKFLRKPQTPNPDLINRFLREAQVAARINHSNVTAVYDVGEEPEACYMVMELLSGGTAGSLLKQSGPLPWQEATRIIAEACAGLQAAHQAGVIHRDLKPDNILFAQSGITKLADFGLVKIVEDTQGLTAAGMVVGTPSYLSPEQATDQPVDVRSDIYSLGATYFTLCAGRPPFMASGVTQLLLMHVTSATPDPRRIVPDIPATCVEIIRQAMEKKPEDRYQSAAAMLSDLETLLAAAGLRGPSRASMARGLEAVSSRSGPGPSATSGRMRETSLSAAGTLEQTSRAASGRRGFLTQGLIGLGLLASGIGGCEIWRHSRDKAAREAAAAALRIPIKVAVVHAQSGPMALVERPVIDMTLFALDEVNAQGGILGRRIEPVVIDSRSDTAQEAALPENVEQLITRDKVLAVFGTWTAGSRKLVRPVVEKHQSLLVFPAAHEGLEESPNILYVGATPSQQILPALRHFIEKLGHKRFFLVGTDSLYPRAVNALLSDEITSRGGTIVGEQYALVGEVRFQALIKKITKAKPSLIINNLIGDSNVGFIEALRRARLRPEDLPVLSTGVGPSVLQQLRSVPTAGDYLAASYFQSSPTPQNRALLASFRKKFGEHRGISPSMEAAYAGVHLWAQAVRAAGSTDSEKIRRALKEQSFDAPTGRIRVDPSNNHVFRPFRLGRIAKQGDIELTAGSDELLPALPFPGPRSRGQWDAFVEKLHRDWKNQWANPDKPDLSVL